MRAGEGDFNVFVALPTESADVAVEPNGRLCRKRAGGGAAEQQRYHGVSRDRASHSVGATRLGQGGQDIEIEVLVEVQAKQLRRLLVGNRSVQKASQTRNPIPNR